MHIMWVLFLLLIKQKYDKNNMKLLLCVFVICYPLLVKFFMPCYVRERAYTHIMILIYLC
jgi:hypothetical protein